MTAIAILLVLLAIMIGVFLFRTLVKGATSRNIRGARRSSWRPSPYRYLGIPLTVTGVVFFIIGAYIAITEPHVLSDPRSWGMQAPKAALPAFGGIYLAAAGIALSQDARKGPAQDALGRLLHLAFLVANFFAFKHFAHIAYRVTAPPDARIGRLPESAMTAPIVLVLSTGLVALLATMVSGFPPALKFWIEHKT